MRDLGNIITGKVWMAGMLAGIFALLGLRLLPFVILSGAMIAVPALRLGWRYGFMAITYAALILCAGWYWLGTPPGVPFPLALLIWPLLLVLTEARRRSGGLHLPLMAMGLIMVIYVIVMHLVTGDVMAFWQRWLSHAMAAVPGISVRSFEQNEALRVVNGFVAMLLGLSLMLALLLGRWLGSLSDQPGSFAPEFRALALSRMVLPLTVAAIWGAGLWEPLMKTDLLMVAILFYCFVGLAVLQGVIAIRGMSSLWLIPIYLMVLIYPPQGLVALALIGALDPFVHFRQQQGQP
ncbi:MAG: hypothetical protein ACK443_12390 [Methylococcaceae bacterium]|jgi:hypothetical protein